MVDVDQAGSATEGGLDISTLTMRLVLPAFMILTLANAAAAFAVSGFARWVLLGAGAGMNVMAEGVAELQRISSMG